MYRLEEASSGEVRQTTSIIAIGPVGGERLERLVGLPALDADHWETKLVQPVMDQHHVEPSDGLHEDQRGLRQLLRRPLLRTFSRGSRASLRDRLRSHAATGKAGTTAGMGSTPWRGPTGVSGAYEAQFIDAEVRQPTLSRPRGATAYLVRRVRRKCSGRFPHRASAKGEAGVRFLSIEPLIAPVGRLDLHGVDWVIDGGESGPHARPIDPAWAIDVRNQCIAARVAFFFKQWGGRSPKSGGRLLEGREWSQFPKTRRRPRICSQNCGPAHERAGIQFRRGRRLVDLEAEHHRKLRSRVHQDVQLARPTSEEILSRRIQRRGLASCEAHTEAN